MKYIAIVLFAPLMLCAKPINFSVDTNISLDTLKAFVPRGVIVEDKFVKNDYEKNLFFAKRYLDSMNKDEKQKASFVFLKTLANLELEKIYQKEKAVNISDDIAYSYYLSHKDDFKTPKSVDMVVLTFKNETDAQKYSLEQNRPKPQDKKVYNDFSFSNMIPNFLFTLTNLEANTLSSINRYNDKFIRIYYTKIRESSFQPYKQVKNHIKNILLSKKQTEIADKIYLGK